MGIKRLIPIVWVSFFSFGLLFSTLAFAKNNDPSPSQAAIEFTKTVGTNSAQCANTKYIVSLDGAVTYCYKVTNTGPVTLTVHDLTDTALGPLLSGFPYTLTPGASFFVTQTVALTQTTVNTATWIASNPELAEIISDTDSATVHLLAACPLGYLPKRFESTTFTTFPPPGWTLENTTLNCTGIPDWTNTDPGGRGNLTGAPGDFAIADSDACGPGSVMTASLTTEPLDFTGYLSPQLVFFTDYKDDDPDHGAATVEVSTDSGANWSPLVTWTESMRGPQIVSYPMPGEDQDDVFVRWQLTDAMTDTWWEVDNAWVVVCSPQPPDIAVTPNNLSSTQPPAVQITKFLNISNDGTLDLDWSIQESPVPSNSPGLAQPPAQVQEILYDQTGDAGVNAISSQAYDSAATPNDNQAADDFTVPALDGAWAISSIYVPGVYLSGTGQIPYVNIYFYADDGGLPGAEVAAYPHLKPVNDANGDLTIDLRYPAVLTAGTYWLSVQAQTFSTSNAQWGWTERTVQTLSASAWRNPGGGLSTPCTDWGARAGTCGVGTEPDLLFQLVGVSSGCSTSDLGWASVSPVSGTLASKGTTSVSVIFDSTGLTNGVYNGNLCTISNDPFDPFVTVPLQLTVVTQPFISLEKTVGTDPAVCATTDTLTVLPDTIVTYCYKMTNTGTVALFTHDLVDDPLGTLLSNESIQVLPGASTFITTTALIRYDTINTATWTGYTSFGISAVGVDSASVLVASPTATPTETPAGTPPPTVTPTPTATATPAGTPPPAGPTNLYLPLILRAPATSVPQPEKPAAPLDWVSLLIAPILFVGFDLHRRRKRG